MPAVSKKLRIIDRRNQGCRRQRAYSGNGRDPLTDRMRVKEPLKTPVDLLQTLIQIHKLIVEVSEGLSGRRRQPDCLILQSYGRSQFCKLYRIWQIYRPAEAALVIRRKRANFIKARTH